MAQICKKEPDNKFTDNMRTMISSLSQSINKISEIEKKIMPIDEKEPENIFIDTMRSMISPLSQSIDKVSEIEKIVSYEALIAKFSNTYSYVIMILINLLYY